MITSKLTSDGGTTVPQRVRDALGLGPGDEIGYEMDGERVVLSRVRASVDPGVPLAVFPEWDAEAERVAEADLQVRRNGSRSFPV